MHFQKWSPFLAHPVEYLEVLIVCDCFGLITGVKDISTDIGTLPIPVDIIVLPAAVIIEVTRTASPKVQYSFTLLIMLAFVKSCCTRFDVIL